MEATILDRTERVTRSVCRSLSLRYSIEFDDLYQDAQVLLLERQSEYDPAKSTETSWAYRTVFWCLCDKVRQKKYKSREERFPEDQEGDSWEPEGKEGVLSRLVRELSEESMFIIRLILNAPEEIKWCLSPKEKGRIRKQLVAMLRSRGWSDKKIQKCFQEIQEAL